MNTQYITDLPANWQDTAKIFEALGSPIRQRILLLFENGDEELTIKQMAEWFALSRTTIAFHLRVLEEAQILQRRAAGREVFFHIQATPMVNALELLLQYIKETI